MFGLLSHNPLQSSEKIAKDHSMVSVPFPRLPGQRSGRSLLLVFIVFYLCFHAVSGERGVYAWFKVSRELEVVKAELVDARTEREILEAKVKLLSSGAVDLDMLDEQARKILGFADPNEMVILKKE